MLTRTLYIAKAIVAGIGLVLSPTHGWRPHKKIGNQFGSTPSSKKNDRIPLDEDQTSLCWMKRSWKKGPLYEIRGGGSFCLDFSRDPSHQEFKKFFESKGYYPPPLHMYRYIPHPLCYFGDQLHGYLADMLPSSRNSLVKKMFKRGGNRRIDVSKAVELLQASQDPEAKEILDNLAMVLYMHIYGYTIGVQTYCFDNFFSIPPKDRNAIFGFLDKIFKRITLKTTPPRITRSPMYKEILSNKEMRQRLKDLMTNPQVTCTDVCPIDHPFTDGLDFEHWQQKTNQGKDDFFLAFSEDDLPPIISQPGPSSYLAAQSMLVTYALKRQNPVDTWKLIGFHDIVSRCFDEMALLKLVYYNRGGLSGCVLYNLLEEADFKSLLFEETTPEELFKTLKAYGPALIDCFYVSDKFMEPGILSYDMTIDHPYPKENRRSERHHAMILVGARKDENGTWRFLLQTWWQQNKKYFVEVDFAYLKACNTRSEAIFIASFSSVHDSIPIQESKHMYYP